MFEVDHANLPKGEEYRELRQFINSMELRSQAERLGCNGITVVSCRYRDDDSGEEPEGHFIASKEAPDNPLLLIREKRGYKGADLFKYHAVPSHAASGRWSDAIPTAGSVH